MLVILEWFAGRTQEQRREFTSGIAKIFAEAGYPDEKVGILFHETPLAATGHGIKADLEKLEKK